MELTVMSVWPKDIAVQLEYGRFEIKNEQPSALTDAPGFLVIAERRTEHGVGAAFSRMEAGWDDVRAMPKFHMRPIAPDEIAKEFERQWQHTGVLTLAGSQPTQEELAEAISRKTAFYVALVREADKVWTRWHQHGLIDDLMREGGKYLHSKGHPMMNERREWMESEGLSHRMKDCPVCMERIAEATVKCKHCGAILDMERAQQYGIAPAAVVASEGEGKEKPKGKRG